MSYMAERLAVFGVVVGIALLLQGHPADEIVAYADSIGADMIVVGSRGPRGVASPLLGSVSRDVLTESRRPVLVVRGSTAPVEVKAVVAA
jgi:nucleotide-binding universal stress UspA family protein